MQPNKMYVGIHNDRYGGMSDIGKIIRDAWVFGLIPETETCEGWELSRLEVLWTQVNTEWEKYGFRVGQLPPELQQKYILIQQAAVETARQAGWDAELDLDEE